MSTSLIDQIETMLDRKLDQKLDKKLSQRFETFGKEIDDKLDGAVERAVGLYAEFHDDKFKQIIEATDFIKEELAKKPNRDEFDELKTEVQTIKHALKATNRDVQNHNKRIAKLESTHA